MVAYRGGVAFAPQLGDTIGVVEANGADGARVTSVGGLRVDPWGHAVVPSLTPFASNDVELDPQGLPMNVTLKSTVQRAVPTAGAVVPLRFDTEAAGRAALLRMRLKSGEAPPFGAQVLDAGGNSVGTLGQDGRAVITGLMQAAGELTVKWDETAHGSCAVRYALPEQRKRDTTLPVLDVPCE
jgi:outer membrane usher protein